jgi:hypothetical protein
MKTQKTKNDDINKLGRLIYNYQSKPNDIDDFYFSRVVDKNTGKLLSRQIEIECLSIKCMIKYQRLIDNSLYRYLEVMSFNAKNDNFIYSASFSISYKFPKFISNIENVILNTSTTDKPYRTSENKTLNAYSNMEYICWNSIDNKKLQLTFHGEYFDKLSNKEEYAFTQVISLFATEASRNPTTYVTAPMVLELAEVKASKIETLIDGEDVKDVLVDLYKQRDRIIQGMQNKYSINDIENMIFSIEKYANNKSLLIKDFFLEYFPMAIDKAVSGSRVTSDKLNKILDNFDNKYSHQYDFGRPNINKEKELEEKNSVLKQLWQKTFPDREVTDLVKDWYDIDLIGE